MYTVHKCDRYGMATGVTKEVNALVKALSLLASRNCCKVTWEEKGTQYNIEYDSDSLYVEWSGVENGYLHG